MLLFCFLFGGFGDEWEYRCWSGSTCFIEDCGVKHPFFFSLCVCLRLLPMLSFFLSLSFSSGTRRLTGSGCFLAYGSKRMGIKSARRTVRRIGDDGGSAD